MKNAMKKILGSVLSLSLIFSTSATVFAAADVSNVTSNTASSVQQEKYSSYEKSLIEISQKYDVQANLKPIEWFLENGFPDESKFTEQLEINCSILANTQSNDTPTTEPDTSSKGLKASGYKTYTWKDTQYKNNFGITVEYSFAISVAQNPDTGKYFISQFSAAKPTLSGTGKGVVRSYSTTTVDSGTTRKTTTQLTLTKDGVDYSKTSSAYVYYSSSNGSITIQGY